MSSSDASLHSPHGATRGDLVLRAWTEDDVDAMVAGCNDPDVAHWARVALDRMLALPG